MTGLKVHRLLAVVLTVSLPLSSISFQTSAAVGVLIMRQVATNRPSIQPVNQCRFLLHGRPQLRQESGRVGSSVVMMAKGLPKNVKATVTQLRQSIQTALQNRCSRMDIELPSAARFGVEGEKQQSEGAIPLDREEDAQISDRELARVIVEMFQGTELESSMVVAFPDKTLANKANKRWGATFKGRIIVFDAKQKKAKRSSGGGGFGSKNAAAEPKTSAIPDGTEVLVVVSPRVKQLDALQTVSNEVGMGCLILLVNARLWEVSYNSVEQRDFFMSEYKAVYHLRPNPLEGWNGAVLSRSFPDDWVLSLPRKIGPPKVLATSPERWSNEEMEAILKGAKEEAESGDILTNIGNAFGFLGQNK